MAKKNNNHTEVRLSRSEYIEKLATESNKINMANRNSKTGKACLVFSFPICTCRPDAPCFKTCYANKGRQTMAVVQGAYYRNLRLVNEDIDGVMEQIYYTIKFEGLPLVRLFDSGDFVNYEFLVKIVELIRKFPEVKFMAFTKKYEMINKYIDEYGELPDNFNILFSAWDYTWKIDNPHNISVAYVNFKDERLNPEIPKNCFICPCGKDSPANCSMCRACWNKKLKGVVFNQH